MLRKLTNTIADLSSLTMQWMLEIGAFILLPLVVYLIVFFSIEVDLGKLYRLPEWMFIGVILHADTMHKLLILYREYKGFPGKLVRTLSIGILGIVGCSICLVLSMLAQEKANFDLPLNFYHLQMGMFVVALYFSAITSIWIGYRGNEGVLLRKMIPEKDQEQTSINEEKSDLSNE